MIGNISKSKGFKGDKGDTPNIIFRYDEKTGHLYYYSDGILIAKEYVGSIKDAIEPLRHYGDIDVTPSDSSLFTFSTDDETMTASVSDVSEDITGDIVIPYKYEVGEKTYIVTSIGQSAFEDCTAEKITIPNSVTIFDYKAFDYCTELKSINIPKGLTYFGYGAFSNCYSLASITLPDDITYIPGSAFYNCDALKTIKVPENVTSIGERAFARNGLERIELPEGVTVIPDMTFLECISLTKVTLPASITHIGGSAFSGCEALTDVYFKGSKAQWDAIAIGTSNEELNTATIHYGVTQGNWSQNDNSQPDYVKDRPFYEYVEETTNESVILKYECYDTTNKLWELTAGDFLGIRTDNEYQLTLRGYNSNNELVREFTANSSDTAVNMRNTDTDGIRLRWSAASVDIIIRDRSSTEYREQFPEYADTYLYSDLLTLEKIYFSDKTITNCEFILTGNFSRIKPKYLPEKYIPDSVARVTDIDAKINELKRMIESLCVRTVTISLLASAWVEDGTGCYQVVEVPGVTTYSKVDLQPTAEQLAIFYEKDASFVTENDGGTITVYCIGTKPANDYIIQATITEVTEDE